MKRTLTIVAKGSETTTKVQISVHTPPHYGRDSSNALASDMADAIMAALATKYRPSKIVLQV